MLAQAAGSLSFASGGDIALDSDVPPFLAQRLADRVHAKPDGIIRSYRGEGLSQARSNGALWQQAGDIAAALSTAGAVPSSCVVILATDILDFLPACWACLRGGFIPVALMHAAREALHRQDGAFARLLSRLGSPVVVVDEYFATMADRLPGMRGRTVLPLASVTPAPAWTDHSGTPAPAWIVSTSGTSGRPSLVALSNDAMLYRNFASRPVVAAPLPSALGIFPLDGLTGQHAAFLHYDSTTQIPPHVLTANPSAILDAVETHEVASVILTSAMIRALLAAEAGRSRTRRLGCLRLVALGAEPILAGIVQDFANLLARHGADPGVLIAGYGATETGSLVGGSRALLTSSASEPVCLGSPWYGVAMRIVDEAGAILPEGEIGDLEISCPTRMFSAYFGDPEQTAAAFTPDGWWRSGDRGQLHGGALTLRGRAKDVLIQHGRKLQFADIDAEIQLALGVGGVGHGYAIPATDSQGEGLGVAFDAGDAIEAAAAIAQALVRRFGIEPRQLVTIAADRLPRTAAGKLKRAALAAEALQLGVPAGHGLPDAGAAPISGLCASRLGAIWSNVLGLDRPARPDDDFFALGGDSLRAVTLDQQIVAGFGVRIPSETFFAAPSFGALLQLVRQRLGPAAQEDASDRGTPWPLPPALRQSLTSALVHWQGERHSDDAVITGYNIHGDRPPMFWVFNHHTEPVLLSQALGAAQPLYAMRSGVNLIGYSEDEIQALALRYVSEIVQICPSGPVFLAGNCQGGIIALAIGHHLLRRKRHVPLLVLVDWAFELQPYQGRVLFVSGARNVNLNPRRLFARPELAWSRAFAESAFVATAGGFAEAFHPGHVDALVWTLQTHMRAAMLAPPTLMPESGYRASIDIPGVPEALRQSERHILKVRIRNDGDIAWGATSASGLVLSSQWLDSAGTRARPLQPRAKIGLLAPTQSAMIALKIVAPQHIGAFTLTVDLVEEGNRWFGKDAGGGCTAPVTIVRRDRPWRKLLTRRREDD